LSRRQRSSGEKSEPGRPHARPAARGRRLALIVEDDRDTREMYARYMSLRGFNVATASDGLAALNTAHVLHPDVIVMDLSLPHLDGLEAARRLKRDPRTQHIPVIACTGRVSGGSAEHALDAGIDVYVTKPCLPRELLAEVRRVLSRRLARGESAKRSRPRPQETTGAARSV
jgi:DNA-binding response OmpR family regulator